jgi:hypothetical protein
MQISNTVIEFGYTDRDTGFAIPILSIVACKKNICGNKGLIGTIQIEYCRVRHCKHHTKMIKPTKIINSKRNFVIFVTFFS